MKKYIILVYVSVIIAILFLVVWHLNQTLIPEKLKSFLINTVEKQTHFSIQIQDLRFHIAKGFELENVKIFDKDYEDEPILKANRVWFKPLLIPSLRKIHIIIPALYLRGAYIKIERDKGGNWNFPKTAATKSSANGKGRFTLSLLKISIKDSIVVFNDSFQDKNITETLNNLNATVGVSLPHSLSLNLNAQIYKTPVVLKGKISNPFKDPEGTLKITTQELDLKNIKYLANMGMQKGLAKIKADLFLGSDGTSTIKAIANIESFKFQKQNLYLTGNFDIDTSLAGNIKTPKLFAYKGNIKFKKVTAAFSDIFPLIHDAAGEALFVDKSVRIKNFTGNIAGSPVSLNGKLDYSADFPIIDINILADSVNLNKLIQNLPETVKVKFKQIDLEGTAGLNINIVNKKGEPQVLSYKGDLKISGANLGCPWLKERIKDIDCTLIFEKDTLTWDKLSFKYKDIDYTSSGIVSELNHPLINGVLESKDLKAKGIIKIEQDLLTIQKLDLGYKKFSLQAKGFLKDFKQPVVSLLIYAYGGVVDITAKLNLKTKERPYLINIETRNIDLEKLIADTKFSKSKLRGTLAANATLNGYLDNKDSLKGKGWVQVSEGYLWEFPVVYDLLNTILGIPPEYILLTDAFGNFTISDKRIYTRDFRMLSEKAALMWEGSLGFDGTLDFNITGRFAEDITTKTTALGKIASAVLHKAGEYIVEIKLTGTIEKPKYKIMPFPIKKILEEKVMDKFKDILGDIFE